MHKIKKTSVTRIVTGRIFSILPAVALQFIIIFAIMKWLAPFATLFLQCIVGSVGAVCPFSDIEKG